MGDDEFRHRFLGGLSPDNQMEVCRMGLNRPIDEILSSLEEIERFKAELLSGANPLLQSQQYTHSSQLYPSAKIEKLNSQIVFLQAQIAQPARVYPQNNEALEKMYIRAVRLGMPPDAPRDLTSLDNYINDELIRRLGVAEVNCAKKEPFLDPRVYAVKKSPRRKSSRKSSKTKKKKSKNKSKKKKSKSGRVHITKVDEQSDSNSSNNDTSSSESEDSSSSSESSSSESESEAEADAEINVNISRVKKK
ncbi:hypothetical protein C1645_745500 [Glomus cerebriforme]|uniref:Uncharacterized protein n=1 Tax=Glomus cerebriforme TaxID=658196 RepID=A0A397S6W3_9GLOM|nr:hypothetical protein C1645_745500 [Glomus cerebriforme]